MSSEETFETLLLSIGCEFGYQADFATAAIVQVEARRDDNRFRIARESWRATPELQTDSYADWQGNPNRRLIIPPGTTVLTYDAEIEISALPDETDESATQSRIEDLPAETLVFLLASRYCLSDALSDEAWRLFADAPPGWLRVQAICDWIHHNIQYRAGASTPLTTSLDVFNQKAGICRDFAHMGITFCRAVGIPARYVFGYLPDIGVSDPGTPMDFHAWFEAYLGGRWRTFDARHNFPRIGRVSVGRGRDAVDCAMLTTFGDATLQTMKVWAEPKTNPKH